MKTDMAYRLVDSHTHILPGMDDGPASADESAQMLARLAEQGVAAAALTPHYFHYYEPLADFLSRRDEALRVIRPLADEAGVRLIPASETYFTEDLLYEPGLDELCYEGTSLLLTETPFNCAFSARDIALYGRLAVNRGVTPVLAHIERYPALLNSEKLLAELREMGCLAQVNISSFAEGGRSVRKRLARLLTGGFITFIGTDCHGMTGRPPEYEGPMALLFKKPGGDFMVEFLNNMARLLLPAPRLDAAAPGPRYE